MVCVHDGSDPTCGSTYNDASGIPTGCSALQPGSAPTSAVDAQGHAFVEVRVCYRFRTIFGLSLPWIGGTVSPLAGDFYIVRARTFTVADY
jgi:hypothetical protein